MKEIIIQLTVVNPFSIQFQTMGMMVNFYSKKSFVSVFFQMEPLALLRAQEPFILMIDTKCTSAIPITIVSSNFKPVSLNLIGKEKSIFLIEQSQFIISECAIESQINNSKYLDTFLKTKVLSVFFQHN